MSREKMQSDARRWLAQAHADLKATRASLAAESFEWAAFQSQQAGEKALKALWYWSGFDEPWGHSLARLIQDMPDEKMRAVLQPYLQRAKELDKFYIPTRYPNGLPDMIPAEAYTESEARQALEHAQSLLAAADKQLAGA